MLGDMFLWLVANLKQGVIYFIKQALPPNISARSVPITIIPAAVLNRHKDIHDDQIYGEDFAKFCGLLKVKTLIQN